jgi:signal transduction histidine kinase
MKSAMKENPSSKNIEERVALAEAKLCLGCIHEGTVLTNLEGKVVENSAAAEQILEVSPSGLRDRSIREFLNTPDVYDDMVELALHEVRAMNRTVVMSTDGGKRKLVNLSIQSTGTGSDARLVHVFQDCADLRTMEARLLQAERLATVGRFASQVAHEIRNPLNSISLNLELLEDELQGASPESRNLIRSVLHEMDRLNDIISDYLQFARFPKPKLRRDQVERAVREAVENVKIPERIALRVHLAGETPAVWLDEALLRQVLDNLLRNAADAISGDGVIEVETDVLDRFVAIRVKDNGSGIPENIREKLFEPFFTTKPHGTGLGLATSQQIIFEHNGHLLVESQPGKGSVFSIMLPL